MFPTGNACRGTAKAEIYAEQTLRGTPDAPASKRALRSTARRREGLRPDEADGTTTGGGELIWWCTMGINFTDCFNPEEATLLVMHKGDRFDSLVYLEVNLPVVSKRSIFDCVL